jgi:uncharacterized ferritin-like protein (DUF455 family)
LLYLHLKKALRAPFSAVRRKQVSHPKRQAYSSTHGSKQSNTANLNRNNLLKGNIMNTNKTFAAVITAVATIAVNAAVLGTVLALFN